MSATVSQGQYCLFAPSACRETAWRGRFISAGAPTYRSFNCTLVLPPYSRPAHTWSHVLSKGAPIRHMPLKTSPEPRISVGISNRAQGALMKLPQTGGCQCGAVRYEITQEPYMVYTCHCTDCQRMTSSAFSMAIMLPADAFRLVAGEPHGIERTSDSGRVISHWICANCSSWFSANTVHLSPSRCYAVAGLEESGDGAHGCDPSGGGADHRLH